jgi:anti-sigma factor RsiW
MGKRAVTKRQSRPESKSHQHQAGRCLHILRELSALIDDELSEDICGEIRRHLGACPRCEEFVASLRQTVSLCRRSPAPTLSPDDRAQMRVKILAAARAR